jgi:hypothetical protein
VADHFDSSHHHVRYQLCLDNYQFSKCDAFAQTYSPETYRLSPHRIGAFQCLKSPKGGFIEDIKNGDQTRVRRQFSAIQQLCVATYNYVDDELFVYFSMDGNHWPDGGSWGLKANSWNGECHLK